MNKRGQVALFVIIAVVLVGLIVAFFAFRDRIGLASIPAEVQPVFSYYDQCIQTSLETAVSLAGEQGGWVDVGTYEPGSDYAPFSSHLQFLGAQIPYWFGVQGNNVVKEHLPTLSDMQSGLSQFVGEHLSECDFAPLRAQGFSVKSNAPQVSVRVEDSRVVAQVTSTLSASRAGVSGVRSVHTVEFASPLGSLYHQAISLYDIERKDTFLEQYAADTLRLYAPVDGVLVQCSPQIWKTPEVIATLQSALEANLGAIRFGNPARASNSDSKYFTVNAPPTSARVLYSPSWPSFIEVSPASQETMIAEPVGNQEGLGIMGFCYVPYHFLYNVRFPVLMQLTEGTTVFQFPVVVVIDHNLPRAPLALPVTLGSNEESDLCSFKGGQIHVSTYSSELNPIPAHVSYQCFEQRCDLGETVVSNGQATLDAAIPLCANGQLIASADNFSESRQIYSSNSENRAEFILERTYPVRVSVFVDGARTSDTTLVHFTDSRGTVSALLPDQPTLSLLEGLYNVTVFVYGNSTLTLPATTKQQCVSSAQGGLFGLFGGTKEECFDVTTPATTIERALRGGGSSSDVYLLASELRNGTLSLYVNSLPQPRTLEQLQTNFETFNDARVEVGST